MELFVNSLNFDVLTQSCMITGNLMSLSVPHLLPTSYSEPQIKSFFFFFSISQTLLVL